MNYAKKIENIIENNYGIIQWKDLKEASIPTIYLTRMEQDGQIERVARGIYINKDADYDEYFFFSQKKKKAIFSYLSSLDLHNFTVIIPQQLEVTLPAGYNTHRLDPNIRVHHANKEIYSLGITEVKTMFGNPVKVYDVERTICDLIKNRNKLDSELFVDGVRNYVKWDKKDMDKLYAYAKKMNILKETIDLFEVLYE